MTALLTLQDPRIDESSGLAASSRTDGVLFTHNDSGDRPRFFAVDREGRTLSVHTVAGARNVDWEDMARGPDEQGRSSLWFGDVGDNNERRKEVAVYRVPEPAVDLAARGARVTTPAAVRFVLAYDDGPHDAEALLVHPLTGRLHVVTKTFFGRAGVYAAPARLDTSGRNVMTRVGELRLTDTGTPGGPGIGRAAQVAVTGGAISPDGSRLALRTYTDAYEWALVDGDVAAAVSTTAARTALPEQRQGESITWTRDGTALLVGSEGKGSTMHQVPSALGTGPAPATTAPATAAPSAAPRSPEPELTARSGPSSGLLVVAALVAGAATLGGLGLWGLRRSRR